MDDDLPKRLRDFKNGTFITITTTSHQSSSDIIITTATATRIIQHCIQSSLILSFCCR